MQSRLKPARQDPLEKVGLPSKGDTTLLDFRAQEEYFDHILTASHQARAPGIESGILEDEDGDANGRLSEAFNRVSISNDSNPANSTSEKSPHNHQHVINSYPRSSRLVSPEASGTHPKVTSTPKILFSLRKLREGIVASHRTDSFALGIFHFVIRFSILQHAPDSYHPSLLSLLGNRSLLKLMSKQARKEMAGYLVLDLACRQEDLPAAYQTALLRGLLNGNNRNNPVRTTLRCTVRGDFWRFFAMKTHLDQYHRVLVSYADERMRKLAIGCLSRAYLKVDRVFVESATGLGWEILKVRQGLMWEEDGRVLVIKKAKVK